VYATNTKIILGVVVLIIVTIIWRSLTTEQAPSQYAPQASAQPQPTAFYLDPENAAIQQRFCDRNNENCQKWVAYYTRELSVLHDQYRAQNNINAAELTAMELARLATATNFNACFQMPPAVYNLHGYVQSMLDKALLENGDLAIAELTALENTRIQQGDNEGAQRAKASRGAYQKNNDDYRATLQSQPFIPVAI